MATNRKVYIVVILRKTMKIKSNLAKKVMPLVVAGGVAIGSSGCGTTKMRDAFWNDPMNKAITNALPGFLVPQGAKEARERERLREYREQGTIWETTDFYDVETGERITSLKGGINSIEKYKKLLLWNDRKENKIKRGKEYRMDFYRSRYFDIKGEKVKSAIVKF